MRCRYWTIGMRDGFGVPIIEVGEIEMPVMSSNLHLLKRITQVSPTQFVQTHRFGVVGHDRQECHTFILVIDHNLLKPFLIILRGGTMIAGKTITRILALAKSFSV